MGTAQTSVKQSQSHWWPTIHFTLIQTIENMWGESSVQPESRPNGQMKTAIRQSQEGVRERGTEGNSFSKMRAGLSCDSYSLKDTPLVHRFLLNSSHMYGNSTCKIFTLHSHILLSLISFLKYKLEDRFWKTFVFWSDLKHWGLMARRKDINNNETIVAAHQSGKDHKAISKQFGVHYPHVKNT